VFTRRTLFILGAGSSFEAGLPVGTELAKIIRDKMDVRFEHLSKPTGNGDHDLYAHLTHVNRQQSDQLWHAAQRIAAGLGFSQSIDDFLDQHRTDAILNRYGKAAIARAVLEAEHNSKLYFERHYEDNSFDPDRFAGTWFAKFIYMLGRGISRENVAEIFDNVSFIIFNYDRCVEYFLENALPRLYAIDDQTAKSIVADLQIIHPYGHVGTLRDVPFGASRADYNTIAQGIKTYTEQIAAADVMEQLANEVSRAACIVFLGFAYHSQNMRLLKPPERISARPIYGTAYKMSESDVSIVSWQLVNFLENGVSVQDRQRMIKIENKITCSDLFDYYAKSLSGD
jgi:hypothetical protein